MAFTVTEYFLAIEIRLSPLRTTCTISVWVGEGVGVGVGEGVGVLVGDGLGEAEGVGVGLGVGVTEGIFKTCPGTMRSDVTDGLAVLREASETLNLEAIPERVSPDLTV